jgi:hypothetical protein
MKKIVPFLLLLSIIFFYSCHRDQNSLTCSVCGTWKIDSVHQDTSKSYFNDKYFVFDEHNISFIDPPDTTVYTVLNNSVVDTPNSQIIWNFHSVTDTFFLLNVSNSNLIFQDCCDGGGHYQIDYLSKVY